MDEEKKTCIAIVQSTDKGYRFRIGGDVIELPEGLNEEITEALESVTEFNAEYAIAARQMWDGIYITDSEDVEYYPIEDFHTPEATESTGDHPES
jgi:hypothetical protein